ncbi:MAG: B12-binding domain-containing radical SAM protein [Theionarchaea archaeon]|nr:B12-binding domain-containing radical SAM protein [Theionarchaea archaeon]
MKILVVRPGVEIVEQTLRGPWPSQLAHLDRLYREHAVLFRAFGALQTLAHSSTIAVGTMLKELGRDVEYLDVPFEFGVPLTEEGNEKRHEKIQDYIAKGGYDVVGISCTSSFECVATQRIAEAAKRTGHDITVMVGGYQASSDARSLMEKIPAIDVIVLSDFEPIAEGLMSAIEGKGEMSDLPNLMYRDDISICTSQRKHIPMRSEDLPLYDYSLVTPYISRYAIFVVEASRGCPYNCSYCQEKTMRKFYTVKDAEVAVDELVSSANYIAQHAHPVTFFYSDPLWGLKPEWVKAFCTLLAERREEITASKFGWIIEARVGQFDEEELALMNEAGCMSIGYGVESLSPEILKTMKKTEHPQQYITTVFDTIEKTLTHNIQAVMFFLFGIPGETPETIQETLTRMKAFPLEKENLHIALSLAHPLRGTLMEKQIHDPQFVEEHGLKILDENEWEKAYIPRLTLLFDPSKTLSASQLADIYLDLVHGNLGIPAFEKQLEVFREVRTILDKEEISPQELAKWSRIFRQVVSAHFGGHHEVSV